MEETYVRLRCPSCDKDWETKPEDLPDSDAQYECPDCGLARSMAEFTRTAHDLKTLKQLG